MGVGEMVDLPFLQIFFFVCSEYIKRKIKRIHIYGCRCNERLKAKTEGSTRLTYTGLRGGLEPRLEHIQEVLECEG
jgi:hypothetical protein